jgi:hypothetical protein
MKTLLFALLLFPLTSLAQDSQVDGSEECLDQVEQVESLVAPLAEVAQVQELDINVSDYCKDQMAQVKGLNCAEVPDVELFKKDESGKTWKLRFHFGFSTTDYRPADLHIQTSKYGVVLKDVDMQQRTGGVHYDPTKWKSMKQALKWIDEPTNTFQFSLEKNKNVFYLTVFHPKYLKSIAYKAPTAGSDGYTFKNDVGYNSNSSEVLRGLAPSVGEGYKRIYFQNSHLNLVMQVGYGRQLELTNGNFGKLTYIPKADIGINYGKERSIDDRKLYEGTPNIQGFNASVANRLEYQKGVISVFAEHKVLYSNIKTAFLDGTIKYDLVSTPLTFGVGIDLFTKNKPKKKKN